MAWQGLLVLAFLVVALLVLQLVPALAVLAFVVLARVDDHQKMKPHAVVLRIRVSLGFGVARVARGAL